MVVALLGAVSAFLPWAHVGLFSVSGFNGSDGWIVLGLFGAILVAMLGGARQLSSGRRLATVLLGGAGAVVGVLNIRQVHAIPVAHVGIGLVALVAAGLTCAALALRE